MLVMIIPLVALPNDTVANAEADRGPQQRKLITVGLYQDRATGIDQVYQASTLGARLKGPGEPMNLHYCSTRHGT